MALTDHMYFGLFRQLHVVIFDEDRTITVRRIIIKCNEMGLRICKGVYPYGRYYLGNVPLVLEARNIFSRGVVG